MAEPFAILGTAAPLSLARALPLSLLVPLTGRFVPTTVTLSLALSLAAAGLFGVEQPIALAGGAWLAAVVRELCLGLTFALACAVPLLAVASTGQLVDRWVRPGLRASVPYGALYELVALFSFFELGGHRAWLESYAQTITDAPFGELTFARASFLQGVLTIGADAIALSLSFALPVLVSLWLCELACALVQRAASGPALSLVELARTVVVALLVLVTAPVVIEALPSATRDAFTAARALIANVFG